MKRILLFGIIAAALSTSCASDALDTFPTNKVPASVVYGSVDNAQSALTGTLSGFGVGGWGSGHLCFAQTAVHITMDTMADDMNLSDAGSGWSWLTYSYDIKNWYTRDNVQIYAFWNFYYTTINDANNLIGAEELLATSPEGKAILGQAYALRAFSYHYLAMIYSRAYKLYPDDPCVPVYTTPTNASTTGSPRSTNAEVYENVIRPDIDKAITYLKDAKDAGVTRNSKAEIDYYVANGIKARICLSTEEWGEAATAATEALKGYDGKILSSTEITSGLNDITALGSVMWGDVKTTDNYGMYGSFQSHMDADHDGYAQSCRPCITSWLYGKMGAADLRRGWWMGDFDSANYETSGEAIKYCQKKFKFKGQTWFGDYIYMRAEEMLLTAAEAYCQNSDDTNARIYLNKLMAKRDTGYTGSSKSGKTLTTSTTGATGSLLEEIIIQRRIELWGEYGRIFDIKRLGQGFKRVAPEKADNPAFDPISLLPNNDTTTPGSFAWVFMIPQAEFDGNQALTDADQNPDGDTK